MTDPIKIAERLEEAVISRAADAGLIIDLGLAARLIRDRQEAASTIRQLVARVEELEGVVADAVLNLDAYAVRLNKHKITRPAAGIVEGWAARARQALREKP
jgi:hypothetical protein